MHFSRSGPALSLQASRICLRRRFRSTAFLILFFGTANKICNPPQSAGVKINRHKTGVSLYKEPW